MLFDNLNFVPRHYQSRLIERKPIQDPHLNRICSHSGSTLYPVLGALNAERISIFITSSTGFHKNYQFTGPPPPVRCGLLNRRIHALAVFISPTEHRK